MKKTLGLTTLTAAVVAAGCAVLPHTTKAPVGMSGPITLNLTNVPGIHTGDRNTQATIRTGALQAVVKVYVADSTYGSSGTAANAIETDPVTAAALVSTSSITTAATSITIPKIPSGGHIITVQLYSSTAKMVNSDGTDSSNAAFKLVGESEAYVSPVVGVPLSATLPIWSTFDHAGNIQTVLLSGATSSLSFSGLTAPSGGLYLRMAKWSASGSLPDSSASLRLSIVSGTAYSTSLASTSNTAGYWKLGDASASRGFSATCSFRNADTYSASTPWNWSSDRKTIYTDLHCYDASDDMTIYSAATDYTTGALSMYLPAALVPTGYTMYLTSLASGSSLAGAGSL